MPLPRWVPAPIVNGRAQAPKRKPKAPHWQGPTHTLTEPRRKVRVRKKTSTPALNAGPVPFDQRPITPGSSITYGDAARQAANAGTVQYGSKLAALQRKQGMTQQLGVDQAGWYDAYLQALRGYQTDTQQRATDTNTAVKALSDSFRSLDQSNLTEQQKALQADAAQRGATVDPRLAQDSSNASLVRQALQGSLGALIATQGRVAGDQASNMANVVGPGQKLQAQARNARQVLDVQDEIASERGIEGAFRQSVIDQIRSGEAKNILAAAIASGKDLTQLASTKETIRHHKADEANTAASRKSTAAAKGQTVNQYGYTAKQWAAYTPEQRRQIMAQVKKEQRTPGKNATKVPKPTQGPGSLTQSQESHVVQQVKGARAAALGALTAPPPEGKPQLTTTQVRQLLAAGKIDGVKYSQDAINAAFDLLPTQYGGHGGLSPANVKALHRMGIHVNGVFPVLGNQRIPQRKK